MKRQLFLSFLLITLFFKLQSQIAGSFTVPGSFPTLAAAINTLNLTGVAGAVTINVTAGYAETVPVGGLKLINPPGSTTTTILFKKQGAGSNPLLMAYSGGTATANSIKRDGIWMLVDCKNVTIDGIDLIDQNVAAPAGMEFGYGFYKASGTASNSYNTIKNCVVTLSGAASNSSHGIELSTNNYTFNTSNISPSSTLHTNSYNTFHNNLIQKCDVGIYILGSGQYDVGNDIGGLSAVTGNTIVNFGGTGSIAQGILADSQSSLNVSYNIINNNNGSGSIAIAGVRGITATGEITAINNNTISLQTAGNSQQLLGISHVGGNGTSTISSNVFPSLTYTSNLVPSNTVIASNGNDKIIITNNQITSYTCNTGTVSVISAISGNTAVINNNTIGGATVTTGQIRGIFSNCTLEQTFTNNSISNLLATSTSSNNYQKIYGIYSPAGWVLTASNNTITNFYGSELLGISFSSTIAGATYSIASNYINNFSAAPTTTVGSVSIGILSSLTSTTNGSMTLRDNIINNLTGAKLGGTTSMGGDTYAIWAAKGAICNIYRNKIYDLFTDGNLLHSVKASGAQNHIYNNLIGEIDMASNGNIYALVLDGSSKLYFNSVYMNASSSTNTVGTNLISSTGNSLLELRNNVLVNSSQNAGVPAILIVNTIAPGSNNNSFYYGTTGLIKRSTPSTTVLSGYQALYNSDSQSFVENPNFVSTTGSNPNFLNINTTIPTQIESGAVAISTITTDFANTIRNNPPDVGAWEGNYVAADASDPVVVSSGFTGPPCNTSTRIFTVNLTDVSGVASGSLAPRLYHRVNFGLYTSTQGSLTSGTATNGIWTFTLNYSAAVNDVIWYFYVFQDVSYLNNVNVVPATNATVTDVNNVGVPPNPAFNYTVQTNPTISIPVTNTTICSGQPFVIQASGASSYSYSPGNSATVSPVASTIYTVTGASSLGCPSTNTVNLNITTIPGPTITVNSGSICSGQSFTMIPNGSSSSYTYQGGSAVVSPVSTSVYTVAGSSANGCVGTASSVVTVNICTELPEIKEGIVNLWPNPSNGTIWVSKNNGDKLFIHIKDLTGRIIKQNSIEGSSSGVELTECVNGVYFVEISDMNSVILRTKLIVVRQ